MPSRLKELFGVGRLDIVNGPGKFDFLTRGVTCQEIIEMEVVGNSDRIQFSGKIAALIIGFFLIDDQDGKYLFWAFTSPIEEADKLKKLLINQLPFNYCRDIPTNVCWTYGHYSWKGNFGIIKDCTFDPEDTFIALYNDSLVRPYTWEDQRKAQEEAKNKG